MADPSDYDETWTKYSGEGNTLRVGKLFGRVSAGWLYAAGSGLLGVMAAVTMAYQDAIEWVGRLVGGFIESALPGSVIASAWEEAFLTAQSLGPFAPVIIAIVLIGTIWILSRLEGSDG